MLQTPRRYCVALSIAGIAQLVESFLQPCPGLDLLHQLRLSPAVFQRSPEIPGAFLAAFTALQNGHVLRPAQL